MFWRMDPDEVYRLWLYHLAISVIDSSILPGGLPYHRQTRRLMAAGQTGVNSYEPCRMTAAKRHESSPDYFADTSSRARTTRLLALLLTASWAL